MKLWSTSFKHGGALSSHFAFCEADSATHVHLAPNHNPHLAWSDIPTMAQSLALVCVDPDAPASPEFVNREDCSIPVNFPRSDFYHWTIINLPPKEGVLEAGMHSSDVTIRGKKPSSTVLGRGKEGINSYTSWFANDDAMKGNYGGYDGPCPPWNDERIHRYFFHLYALKIPIITLPEIFDGNAVMTAIQPHIIESATLETTYTLNRIFL